MVMIANLQYGWTLFVDPIDQKYHWGKAAIQVAFTIFVLTETWLVPFEGYLVDKYGPRVMIGISGVLVAIAWVINAFADRSSFSTLGCSRRYRRGRHLAAPSATRSSGSRIGKSLAAGLTAAGFGAGSALTVVPIANMIRASATPHSCGLVLARV
jgi:OFA family oxalate/formate antiporter-like MFS transporter